MSYEPDLRKVSVLVKTFLRDRHLFAAVHGLRCSMPEARIIVVDDGDQSEAKDDLYALMRAQGHQTLVMPFDSGFGAKSNRGALACDTEYMLVGSDDFDFSPLSVRRGVERLVTVLDHEPSLDIASGRVNGARYEGTLEDHGDWAREVLLQETVSIARWAGGVRWMPCDLTVNYSLIRSSAFRGDGALRWFDDIKIGGGEHGAFFVEAKRHGHKVAWVPNVDIREQEGKPTDPRYFTFRGRAQRPGRPAFRRIGIERYVLFDGSTESC